MKIVHNKQFPVKVYFINEGQELNMIDTDLANYATMVQGFGGKAETHFVDLGPKSSNTILIGLGKKEDLKSNTIRTAAYKAGTLLEDYGVSEASVIVDELGNLPRISVGQCTVEGLIQSTYSFDYYKSVKKDQAKLQTVGIISKDSNQEEIDEAIHIIKGIHVTRDLVNLRANDLTPVTFGEKVLELFADLPVEVKVYNRLEIEELGMEALLTVGKGSTEEPVFIKLTYLPEGDDQEALALVGKGMTYDSGGYAIKPAKSMVTMQTDMAGAGSVVGTIHALASQGVKKNVIGLVPSAESMISGQAMRNGDIITTLKGSTVEINNTDAEGRLILADALYYGATQVNSSAIVDVATLTGAAIAALGDKTAAVMTNDQSLLDQVLETSQVTGEPMWQLPKLEDMYEKVKGSFGDLNNAPGGGGGTITAGLFLEHFVENKPWVHLDIAGPSWTETPYKYYKKGASGFSVNTLYHFAKQF